MFRVEFVQSLMFTLKTLALTVLYVSHDREWYNADLICDTLPKLFEVFSKERCGLMFNTLISFIFTTYEYHYIVIWKILVVDIPWGRPTVKF